MLDKTAAYLEAERTYYLGGELPDNHPFKTLHEEAQEEVKLLRSMPEIVMLAGSSRYKQAFEQTAETIALQGKIVLGKSVYKPGEEWNLTEREKDMIHAIQFRMCDLASRLHIVNVDAYIGEDTYNLIRYALRIDRTITFHEPEVRLMTRSGQVVTSRHFIQATKRRVEFEEAALH